MATSSRLGHGIVLHPSALRYDITGKPIDVVPTRR